MDFGLLPPEINSARMYTGPGPGPMLSAAAAWDELAAELSSATSSYHSVIAGLTGAGWQGPASASMAAAAASYVTWMRATAAQAEQTATQARAAVAAYETAFAATVPPPVIAANRALLMSLIASNIVGQNTPAIAATEFHYAEMWAQDATAMYGYAISAATASEVTPFTPPPQTTNAAGLGSQATAVAHATGAPAGANAQTALAQLISAAPQALQGSTSPVSSAVAAPLATTSSEASLASALNTIINFATGPVSPLSSFTVGGVPYLLGIQSVLLPSAGDNAATAAAKVAAAAAKASGGVLGDGLGSGARALGAGSALSGAMGGAGSVGGLSVPPSWGTAAPAIRTAAATLPITGLDADPMVFESTPGNLFGQMGWSSLVGRAVGGTGAHSVGAATTRAMGATTPGEATTATIFVLPATNE